ncbi:MAG: ABC transporter ATP-binding protein [Oligoflexia bacterium]|nr:ABC transporter ATP-binding protein [Oligoflexia bacterium]
MLQVIGVSKKFGQKTALNSIDLNVSHGEFVSILGPSGCGKTTLLRILAGLEKPDSGKLILDEKDITQVSAHHRDVHTVFQRYALFPHMNIFDNVAFGLRCSRVAEPEVKRRVDEMLELANLSGQGKRTVTSLSGGEQQRVALIRALVNMPKLLLLDEPLGALDLKLRLQLQQELVAIQRRVKTTFVFVTHDQQEALNMSDRVAVMNKAKIVQLGTPLEIYEFPKCLFVANFVGNINRMDGKLRQDDAGRWVCDVESLGTYFVEPTEENKVAGQPGALCVRSEKLSLFSRKPSTVDNVAEGSIRALTYLGTHTQFDLTLKNGTGIQVFQQNTQKTAKKVFQAGDKVFVGWHTAQSHYFTGNQLQ